MFEHFSDAKFAYLAGIIDGEGCVYIGTHSVNKKTGAKYFVTCLQVANTDIRLIDWLYENFGGDKRAYTFKQTAKNVRKTPYVWKLTGPTLTEVCQRILPFSTIKQEQIKVMLEMRQTYEKHPSQREKVKPNGIQPLSENLINHRLFLMQKLRSIRN